MIVGEVSVVSIDNPPLNTLTKVVRLRLQRDLRAAIDNPVCKVILLVGCGRAFSVGADIKELASQCPRASEQDAMAAYVNAYNTHNVRELINQLVVCSHRFLWDFFQ
jgi:enoyl-CoA hydratase/carnithine racemase